VTRIRTSLPFAAIAVALALGGCAGAASTNSVAPLALSGVRDAQAVSAGVYKFNPPSPLSMTVNTTVNVTIGESKYSGPFRVSGCSGSHCAKAKYGWACWSSSTNNDINSITAQIKASPTMIMTEYAAGQYYPAAQCIFSIKDSKGRTATYEASAPAKF
jgi:hypothetical protein